MNEPNTFTKLDIGVELDEISSRFENCLHNLSYMTEAAENRGMDKSVVCAFYSCTDHLWLLWEQLSTLAVGLFAEEKKAVAK